MNQFNRTRLAQIREHLLGLQAANKEARAEGDWDRVDFIGYAIDDTRAEIAALEAGRAS